MPTLPGMPDLPELPDLPSLGELPDFGDLPGGLSSMDGGLGGEQDVNANTWLILDEEGNELLEFKSFISLDVRAESQVVSSAVEEGSFASYNKVEQPLAITAQLAFAGTEEEIQDAVFMLQVLREETLLVSLVTPDAEFESLSLESFSYSRKREDGIGVLYCDLSFVEVKQVETQYTNVQLAPRRSRGLQQAENESMLQKASDWLFS